MRSTRGRLWTASLAAGALAVTFGSATLAQSPSAPAAGGKPQIVWLEQGAGNPYWDAQHNAAAAAGAKLGFDFKAVSGNLDPAQQAATLRQLVDQGVSVIMLNAIDPTATAPAVAYANEKGVPVVSLYAIDPSSAASVTFDEVKVGDWGDFTNYIKKKKVGEKVTIKVTRGEETLDIEATLGERPNNQ